MSDTKRMVMESIDLWNARDRDAWFDLFDRDAFEFEGPGGVRGAGAAGLEAVWNTWNDAFPENKIGVVGVHGEAGFATHQGVFEGIQTGPLAGPAGRIEATGKVVSVPFVMVYRSQGDKVTGMRLYFDKMELLGQLGIVG